MTRSYLGYVSSQTTDFIPLMTYGVATGGTSSSITVSGTNYTLLTFTSDGSLVVSEAGLFDVLLVGGGGGGGGQNLTRGSGGGGGGQVIGQTSLVTLYLAAGTYTVDVGAGGAGGNQVSGVSGSPSEIEALISACAGKGATSNALIPLATNGSSGGSYNSFTVGVTQGSVNVNSGGGSVDAAGGGGGGAAGTGGAGSGTTGGAGGNGLDISAFITGATYYAGAGGGGGAQTTGGAAGNGGVAGKTSGTGNNGVNYGAGGGGTYGAGTTGGNGAAGAVWVRFKV